MHRIYNEKSFFRARCYYVILYEKVLSLDYSFHYLYYRKS